MYSNYRESYPNTSSFSKHSGIWMTWKIDFDRISKSKIHKSFHFFFQNSSSVWSRKGYSRNEYVVLLFKTIFLGNNQINLIWNALGIEGVIENAKIELIFRHASDLELIFSPRRTMAGLSKFCPRIMILILYNWFIIQYVKNYFQKQFASASIVDFGLVL
jgi:hypothetical protein